MTSEDPVRPDARLTSGPVRGHLVRMALPMILALFAIMAVDLTDTYFVGKLGSKELAALSFGMPAILIVVNMGVGLGAGTSSVLARILGGGRAGQAKRMATHSLLLGALIGALTALVGCLTIDPLFRWLGAGPGLIDLMRFPMVLNYIALGFVIPSMMGMAAIRATGDSKRASQVMILAAIINAVLDPILIFGLLGAPRLELTGASLATLIARIISAAYGFYVLRSKAHLLTADWRGYKNILASWVHILKIGLPAVGTNIIVPLSTGLLVVLVARYGEDAVAGYGVATRIESLSLIAFYAVSSIVGPFVGQNAGAGLDSRIKEAIHQVAYFCLGTGFIIALILWLFGPVITAQFSDTARISEIGTLYLTMVPLSFGAAGITMAINASFNGLGHPLPAVAISLVRVFVILIPLALLGNSLAGLWGIFGAVALSHILSAIGGYVYFIRRFRKVSVQTEQGQHSPPMQ